MIQQQKSIDNGLLESEPFWSGGGREASQGGPGWEAAMGPTRPDQPGKGLLQPPRWLWSAPEVSNGRQEWFLSRGAYSTLGFSAVLEIE
jgi:hypothetical protein